LADNELIAFEKFYRRFHPSLMAFATYLMRSEQNAQEVVNDVFLNIWDKRDVLILDDSLKSYLFQSTKNRSINHLKKNNRSFLQIEDEEQISISPDVLSQMEEKDNEDRLFILINQLPPKCRQVFSMSRLDDLSYREISELMEISTKTVENQMTKALKFFRKNLNME
jgi:RNA polymerase sigma-70 factor (ECF subfamily)